MHLLPAPHPVPAAPDARRRPPPARGAALFTAWLRAAALALTFLAGTAQAQVSTAVADQLMRASGMWQQLGALAPQMASGLLQGLRASATAPGTAPGAALDEATLERIASAARAAYDAERMRAVVRRTLAEGVRAEHVPALLDWYATDTGRLLTQAEEADSLRELEMAERTQQGAALLEAASPERRQLLAQVVEVTRAAQTTTDTVINLVIATQASLQRFQPRPGAPQEGELRAQLAEQRPQMLRAFEGLSLASFALIYQAVPDDAVARYVRFLAGAAGDHFSDIGQRALEAALLDATARLAVAPTT